MNTPVGAGAAGRHRESSGASAGGSALWRCVDCLAGGIIAALLFLSVLPGLVELTRPLDSLAATVLLFALLFAWFVLWALVGAVREWALGESE